MGASYFGRYTAGGYIDETNNFNFYISADDLSYLHKVVVKLGAYSKTIDRVKARVTTDCVIPMSWLNAIPNATQMNGTISLTTYQSNYSTQVGSTLIKPITFKVPENIKPNASVSISEAISGINEQFGAFVQGKSKINAEITANGSYSSTITSYNTTINDVNYTSSSFTTDYINSSTSSNYTIKSYSTKVTDSRGRTYTKTGSYKVLTYSNPKINNFEVFRCNEDGTANDEGTYVKISSSASIKPCNDGTSNKNTKIFKLYYKLTTSNTWTEIELPNGNYDLSDTRILSGFDINNSYDFKLYAEDFFTSIEVRKHVETSFSLIDYHSSGTGIAFGKASERENAIEFGMDCFDKYDQEVFSPLLGGVGGQCALVSGDWNTACGTRSGFYMGQNMENRPTNYEWFYVIHLCHNENWMKQIAFSFYSSGIWVREKNNGNWNAWRTIE